jgi:glucose/arabinose dehydrogenase
MSRVDRLPRRRLLHVLGAGGLATALPPAIRTAVADVPERLDGAYARLAVEVRATGLHFPWSAVQLPGGALLVSEKHPGRLRRVRADGTVSAPLKGVPEVFAEGNAGLLGLALDPDFARNRTFYVAFAEPGEGGTAALTVARAELAADRIDDLHILFRQRPKVADIRDFGGRIAIGPDGHLYVATGDLFARDLVQRTDNTIGVVARITTDGAVPADNPFVGREGHDPTIWSLGHRNPGAAAFHPETGRLWLAEFGPFGGDELNIVEPGRNYGWPRVSWGRHYTGEAIPAPPTRPDLAPSLYHWNPVIGPSGMAFYDAEAIPAWRGSLLIGGLTSQSLIRLTLRGERVIAEERLPLGVRIRDVLVARDGAVLLLTDEPAGRILRLAPVPD